MDDTRAVALRVAALVGLSGALQIGPVAHQLLGLPLPPLTMSWSMYSGVGRDLCAVRWRADGRPVSRADVLGATAEAGGERLLHSPEAVRLAARPLCEALQADVRAEAWCAGPDGRWVVALGPEERLCP
ncbi:MAG: hypothetical protein R3F59_09080 [Myxococcota bacterium]